MFNPLLPHTPGNYRGKSLRDAPRCWLKMLNSRLHESHDALGTTKQTFWGASRHQISYDSVADSNDFYNYLLLSKLVIWLTTTPIQQKLELFILPQKGPHRLSLVVSIWFWVPLYNTEHLLVFTLSRVESSFVSGV